MTDPGTDIATRTDGRPTAAASEATKIEQTRARAEVEAAIFVAQKFPRHVDQAVDAMRQACSQRALADRAFFRYPRSGETVTGESIHLARELARVWGNVQYGIAELDRDDSAGQSEMLAEAWDVQTNTRVRNAFIVPHARDTKRDGRKPIVELRDIYENNTNMGARRVRECIFAVLPRWFIEEAKATCRRTLADGGGKPRELVISDAIALYATRGITRDQLQDKLGRTTDKWTDLDIAQLRIIWTSLEAGEMTIDEEFPTERVTLAEITDNAAKRRERRTPAAPAADTLDGPTEEDLAAMRAEAEAALADRD